MQVYANLLSAGLYLGGSARDVFIVSRCYSVLLCVTMGLLVSPSVAVLGPELHGGRRGKGVRNE